MKIRFDVWLQQQLSPPPSKATARHWIKRGVIEPAPQKIGSTYYVEKGARFRRDRLKVASPLLETTAVSGASQADDPVSYRQITAEVVTGHETISQLLETMPTYHLSASTISSYCTLDARIRRELGNIECSRLDVRQVADYLRKVESVGPSSARTIRSRLHSVCRRGIALGWMVSNPVAPTHIPKPPVKRRRLSLEEFEAILAKGRELNGWLENAMLLALVSGQDRSTVANWHESWVGEQYAVVKRSKSKIRIAIPLSLTLDVLGMSLKDVLEKCKATGSFEGHYIHRLAGRSLSPGRPHNPHWITNEFERARSLAGILGPDAPSFHEIRSLAKRLYLEQGNVDTKMLLGHRSDNIAALYADSRGGDPLKIYFNSKQPFIAVSPILDKRPLPAESLSEGRPVAFIRAANAKPRRR